MIQQPTNIQYRVVLQVLAYAGTIENNIDSRVE